MKVLILALCVVLSSVSAVAQAHVPEPSLRDTLDWLTGTSLHESGDGNEYIEFESKGCQAIITEHRLMAKPEFVIRTGFNFADLDPKGFSVIRLGVGKMKPLFGDQTSVQFHTKNYLDKMASRDTRSPDPTPSSTYEFTTNGDFAPRFARAMRRAAILCSAKPSSF